MSWNRIISSKHTSSKSFVLGDRLTLNNGCPGLLTKRHLILFVKLYPSESLTIRIDHAKLYLSFETFVLTLREERLNVLSRRSALLLWDSLSQADVGKNGVVACQGTRVGG